jgi:hypothetical protein
VISANGAARTAGWARNCFAPRSVLRVLLKSHAVSCGLPLAAARAGFSARGRTCGSSFRPLELHTGVALLVDEGVTLFAFRNPRYYDASRGPCGTIDGQGGAKISGQNITWWELADKARAGGTQK